MTEADDRIDDRIHEYMKFVLSMSGEDQMKALEYLRDTDVEEPGTLESVLAFLYVDENRAEQKKYEFQIRASRLIDGHDLCEYDARDITGDSFRVEDKKAAERMMRDCTPMRRCTVQVGPHSADIRDYSDRWHAFSEGSSPAIPDEVNKPVIVCITAGDEEMEVSVTKVPMTPRKHIPMDTLQYRLCGAPEVTRTDHHWKGLIASYDYKSPDTFASIMDTSAVTTIDEQRFSCGSPDILSWVRQALIERKPDIVSRGTFPAYPMDSVWPTITTDFSDEACRDAYSRLIACDVLLHRSIHLIMHTNGNPTVTSIVVYPAEGEMNPSTQ